MEQIPNPNTVRGYNKLPESVQIIFSNFLKKFYMAQGTDSRKTIIPKTVKLAKEDGRMFIRFDYQISQRAEWLHVSKNSWY